MKNTEIQANQWMCVVLAEFMYVQSEGIGPEQVSEFCNRAGSLELGGRLTRVCAIIRLPDEHIHICSC